MADEHNETEDTTVTEDTAGAEDTASAEEAGAVAETAAEESAAEETAATEEASAAAEPAAAEDASGTEDATPAEDVAEAGETAAVEDSPGAGETAAEDAAASEEAGGESAAPATHTYDELKGMTVVQMREIAESMGENDALHGYTTMHKEELLVALCKAQGIEAHEHHEVVGIDKVAVKAKIRALKDQRQALIEAKDAKQLKIVRRRIRSLKRKIHKATV